jgi:hypothetical protein
MFNISPPENRGFYDIMWKNMVEPDRLQSEYNTVHALCMTGNYATLKICNT